MRGISIVCLGFGLWLPFAQAAAAPVLVELFTSEGCSDCPPADRLLEQLDGTQPVAGAQIIVLSEHVDYWDRLGWKDPFSQQFFSERQEKYARHFGLNSVYTPQMVVDGGTEFVGSDGRQAVSAIEAAAKTPKAEVRIQRLTGGAIRVQVDRPSRSTDVYLAVVEKRGASQVLRGENQGRRLQHIDIVRRIEALGRCEARSAFVKEVRVHEAVDAKYRLVAFVQDGGSGHVGGAAVLESK